MRLKDYYRTLEVNPLATADELKRSFRRLALQYHPDRNAGNPFAEGHFREIKEAYDVLSDEKSRKKYDQERWLAGSTTRAGHSRRTTPTWLLHETARLRRHMETIDTYRMNQPALQHYVLLLLGDEPLDRMREAGDATARARVAGDILAATTHLRPDLLAPIVERLLLLAGEEEGIATMVRTAVEDRYKAALWEKRFPLLLLLVFLVIGFLIGLIHLF
jgi:curved DNA-binding protein CbpA